MASRLFGAKPLSKLMTFHQAHTKEETSMKKNIEINQVSLKKLHLNLSFVMLLPFWGGDGLPIRDEMYFHVEYIPWNTLLCFVLFCFIFCDALIQFLRLIFPYYSGLLNP